MDLRDLNDEQRRAVLTTEGPILVLAGAGSGKTKVLTTKIAYLIEECGIPPYNILAITFTNKAAGEMKSRLISLIGDKANDSQISTFHSFGVKIIRENATLLGYTYNFNIVDSDDSLTVIKKILKDMNIDPKIYNPYNIRNRISSAKNEMISPDSYKKYACSDFEEIVYNVYSKYEIILKKNNSVDFDDLLLLPIKLFKEYTDVLSRYQERYKYILIDEYQDTNEAQYILTKLISSKYKNICCVGDNDQSIYGFRGANYRNILNFEKDYKNATVIKLEQNYRSTTTILDAANDVIKNNKERKDKNLWSNKGKGEKITYYKALSEVDEALYVTKKIKEIIKNNNYQDIAVIYRTNAQSRVLEEAFLNENIPYHIVGGVGFYNRKEIKDLLAYLRLVNNINDDISLSRIINVPKRGIGAKTVLNIEQKALKEEKSMYEVIDSGKELVFKNIIEELINDSHDITLTDFIEDVLEKTGIKEEYINEHSLEADIRLENLEEFKTITRTFEEESGEISLSDFLQSISLLTDIEGNKDPNTVNLMTVHSVKGLEFPYVFVVGLEDGLFPHINSISGGLSELEEERRLMYVALTRAKEKLFLVNARVRKIFGENTSCNESRFINEINQELIDKEFVEEEKTESKVFFDFDSRVPLKNHDDENNVNVEYNIGDNVFHDVFGAGKVLEVGKSTISIAFKHPYGIKKLMKNHKSINKL